MNYLELAIQILIGLAGATALSLMIAMCIFFILKLIVYIFELNYGRDVYWVFTFTNYVLIISWIVSFGYFMSTITLK